MSYSRKYIADRENRRAVADASVRGRRRQVAPRRGPRSIRIRLPQATEASLIECDLPLAGRTNTKELTTRRRHVTLERLTIDEPVIHPVVLTTMTVDVTSRSHENCDFHAEVTGDGSVFIVSASKFLNRMENQQNSMNFAFKGFKAPSDPKLGNGDEGKSHQSSTECWDRPKDGCIIVSLPRILQTTIRPLNEADSVEVVLRVQRYFTIARTVGRSLRHRIQDEIRQVGCLTHDPNNEFGEFF
ncbi:hypothetical protein EVAR_13969_1 [Eumeta japonica]|uniref:Uncharacterized protein n=1 Tax=Eumeta variegata TaxID=151549 RepID=A0A4C1U8S3_EUMVA|nr:hypothetical protein EVAR_13969_1 [Eumeta japonica]